VNSLPKTVTRERRGYDLNPGPSASESSTLTTRLPPGHERARGALSKYRTEPTTAAPVSFLTSFGLGVGTAPDGHGERERGEAGSDDRRRQLSAIRLHARRLAFTRRPETTTRRRRRRRRLGHCCQPTARRWWRPPVVTWWSSYRPPETDRPTDRPTSQLATYPTSPPPSPSPGTSSRRRIDSY